METRQHDLISATLVKRKTANRYALLRLVRKIKITEYIIYSDVRPSDHFVRGACHQCSLPTKSERCVVI